MARSCRSASPASARSPRPGRGGSDRASPVASRAKKRPGEPGPDDPEERGAPDCTIVHPPFLQSPAGVDERLKRKIMEADLAVGSAIRRGGAMPDYARRPCASISADTRRRRPATPTRLRELTAKGRDQASSARARLASLPAPPVLVLASPLVRARQTAEAIAVRDERGARDRAAARAGRDVRRSPGRDRGPARARSRPSATSRTAPRSRSP